jgi:hypothetical protein
VDLAGSQPVDAGPKDAAEDSIAPAARAALQAGPGGAGRTTMLGRPPRLTGPAGRTTMPERQAQATAHGEPTTALKEGGPTTMPVLPMPGSVTRAGVRTRGPLQRLTASGAAMSTAVATILVPAKRTMTRPATPKVILRTRTTNPR